MDTSTATTAPKSNSAERALEISPFGRPRPPATRRGRDSSEARAIGSSRLRDARRDLSMFDPRPAAAVAPRSGGEGERLDPLLPPVISEPPRRRRAVARLRGELSRGQAAPARDRIVQPDLGPRRRARLTRRGYAAVLGLVVGGVALCSAITVGQGSDAPQVEPTQVVARGGESVQGLAERAAQGRDVQDVAESIRAANGLGADEVPQAGEVLLVPGS